MSTQALTTDLTRKLTRRGFTGLLIEPGNDAYEDARRVWSGSIDRRPAGVARCRDSEDVAAAVSTAVELGLPLAVRGGGHSVAGHGTCDDGLVVDLSPMRQVRVDPVIRRASVAGGALLADLDAATQEHGLGVPAGQVSHTGVAGLTLGGGVGYTMREFGLTIDSLLSAEVVTAAGETVLASEEHNPDLFWALRGGGGNFGVVTRFDFELHEFGPLVYAGVLVFPFEQAAEVLRASRELMANAPDELTIHEILITVPDHEPFPAELHGTRAVFLTVTHLGDDTQAEADVEPLRALGPAFDLLGPMPYVALQSMIDDDTRAGQGQYSKSHWLGGYDDQLIDTLIDGFGRCLSPRAHLITARMGGAIERVPAAATAFANRSAANLLWIIDLWDAGAEPDEPHREWVNGVLEATRPHSTGAAYVNALDDEGPERICAAYGEATFARLRRIKRDWDPANVFRLNQNIPPAGD